MKSKAIIKVEEEEEEADIFQQPGFYGSNGMIRRSLARCRRHAQGLALDSLAASSSILQGERWSIGQRWSQACCMTKVV